MRRALITGITGQDGSYLAELLLEKGYEVHGVIRRSSSFNTGRIDHIFDRLHLHYGDMADLAGLANTIEDVKPDELYNLASQSHVRVAFDLPVYTSQVGGLGVLGLLDIVRAHEKRTGHQIRVYQAASSEMFGSSPPPQNEDTPFRPCSPYGAAKLEAYWNAVNYRTGYGMFVCNGILFNHESPRRGETFVTRKIAKAAARISLGLENVVYLGNLAAQRDWGYAGDYVQAMWLMLQQDAPGDYVIGTGEMHSVQEFLDLAWEHVGLEKGRYIILDRRLERPVEVERLCGDASKARKLLDWEPAVKFKDLVRMMVDAELASLERTNGCLTQ